jgi:porin
MKYQGIIILLLPLCSAAVIPPEALGQTTEPASRTEPPTPPPAPESSGPPETSSKPPVEGPKAFDLRTTQRLTGDWRGARKELEDRGISLKLSYQQQFQQNVRGGLDTHNGHRFSGSYDLVLELDFGKMGLLEDAGFYIKAKGAYSDGINPNKVGALNNVNQDAQGDEAIFVNKYWFWKKFADKKFELRLGLLQTNKDLFDVSPYANHEDIDFINRGSIRNATIPHRNGLGAFLRYIPSEWFYVQIIGLDSQWQRGKTGFDTGLHGEASFVGMWEAGVKPKWSSEKGPMPGNARVGIWYDPTVKTVYRDTLGGARLAETQTGDVGYYFGADQLVWKENADEKDKQGLGLFTRYGHAHADRNRINHYWSIGASYLGLIPERDKDVLGLAASQSILSKKYREARDPLADRETVYECYYQVQVTPSCTVAPHLQVVTNPGGDKDDRDSIIGGVRIRVIF